jgi:hypothetical protein
MQFFAKPFFCPLEQEDFAENRRSILQAVISGCMAQPGIYLLKSFQSMELWEDVPVCVCVCVFIFF